MRIQNKTYCQEKSRKILLLSWLLSLFIFQAYGQNIGDPDKYPEEIRDSLYYELFKIYRESDKKLALSSALKAFDLSRKNNHVNIFLKAANGAGWLYQQQNNYDSALYYHNEGLSVAIKYDKKDRQMYTYYNLGIIYNNLHILDRALDNYFKSLKLSRELNQLDVETSCLSNIGVVYRKLKNNTQALAYFQQCLELMKETGNELIDETTVNIGFLYIDLNQHQEAVATFKTVLETNSSLHLRVSAYYGLAESYFKLNEIQKAEQYIQLTLDSAQKDNNDYFTALSYLILGKIANTEKNYAKAIKDLNTALNFAQKAKSIGHEHDIYLLRSEILSKQKEFEKAYFSLHQAYIIQDSLQREDFAENFKNIHLKIEKEKADEIILNKEIQIERQRLITIGTGIISTLAFFAALVFWRSTVIVKRSRNALSDANEIIEKQNKELTQLNHSLERMVEERTHELLQANNSLTRVNDELDNFINMTSKDIRGPLASLRGVCNVAMLDVKDPVALDYITRLDKTTNSLNSIFTRMLVINQINHETLSSDRIDFSEIISEVLQLEKAKGIPQKIKIDFCVDPNIVFYSDRGIIRLIIENLVNNAIKYHDPSESVESFISVKVHRKNEELKILVLDNGVGLDNNNKRKLFNILNRAPSQPAKGGVGLYLTKLACEKLGGSINLDSSAEGYTQFTVAFPIQY